MIESVPGCGEDRLRSQRGCSDLDEEGNPGPIRRGSSDPERIPDSAATWCESQARRPERGHGETGTPPGLVVLPIHGHINVYLRAGAGN